MSSQLSLLDMPYDEMRIIMEYLGLGSILTLRKTCHHLRNFIDEIKPDSQVRGIEASLTNQSITVEISHGPEYHSISLKYYKHPKGLNYKSVVYDYGEIIRSRNLIIKNQSYIEHFLQDFESLLKFQKTEMKFLTLCFPKMENQECFDKIQEILKDRQLKIKSFKISTQSQSEVMKILPWIDAKSLELLDIAYFEKVELPKEIVGLEQWKKAKKLEIYNFTPAMMDHCLHFSEIRAYCERVPEEEVAAMREIMSSELTLLQMPQDEMLKIMDFLDLESILTLRNTCHELRNFIDDVKPNPKILNIDIKITNQSICLNIGHELQKYRFQVEYQKADEGCAVFLEGTERFLEYTTTNYNHRESKFKFLAGTSFFERFLADFKVIVDFQKKVLPYLKICLAEEDRNGILTRLGQLSVHYKVKNLGFFVQTPAEIFKILPLFDAHHLKDISIDGSWDPERVKLPEGVYELEQWRNAETLKIMGFEMEKIRRYLHFLEVDASCETISKEDVLVLKNNFLNSPRLQSFTLHLDYIDSHNYKLLGPKFHVKDDGHDHNNKAWFFRTWNPNKIMCFEIIMLTIKLYYVKREELPANCEVL